MGQPGWMAGMALLAGLAMLPPAAVAAGDEAATGEAACGAIARAVHEIGAARQFHSRMVARTPGRRRPVEQERFVLGDVVYANSPGAGRWIKLPLTEADRDALEASFLAHPLQNCREEGRQDLDGTAVRLFSYQQTLPRDAGESVALGRIWIAEADGRPRRYEGRHGEVSVLMLFDYENIAPPFRQ
ncbi:LolA-like protein [Roseomonas marmotae]|uniref:Uncharacterized protein n=1 Tax=Roseomonas marmotae TaxID=2768161 RepID=A0ABS3KD96_9PROT|nr:hypothetical protein [Roseomonas marmotae]MBO1075449.1 hypothetical protein [Roseomonas marmotae]QTI81401.1 hypothetical protein IAI58_18790 [Roseomonas marmotae]